MFIILRLYVSSHLFYLAKLLAHKNVKYLTYTKFLYLTLLLYLFLLFFSSISSNKFTINVVLQFTSSIVYPYEYIHKTFYLKLRAVNCNEN